MSTVSIMWLSICWLPLLMWLILRNNARFKKNIVVGVTLPQAARDDTQVTTILTRYRRQQMVCSIILTIIALIGTVAGALRTWAGPLMMCWSLWILASCIIPESIFALTNHKLAILKSERGWHYGKAGENKRVTIADISAAAQQYPRISEMWFFVICIASLVPILLDYNNLVIYLPSAACTLLMWVTFQWFYRNRSEIVDGNTDLTQTLTRIRRRAWACVNLTAATIFALMSWSYFIFQASSNLYLVSMILLGLFLIIVAFATEMRVRGLQERLTKASGKDLYVDEDDHWIFGIFYYNPDDTKLIVNDRIGINTSFNLARPAGKAIAIAITFILLCLPVAGVFMADEFGTPVSLELSGQTIKAYHSLINYEIDMNDVLTIELVNQLPQMTRTSGGAADTFLEGNFLTSQHESLKVCLNPEAGPWLLIHTKDNTSYLLGANDTAQTKTIFEKISIKLQDEFTQK
ncbi:hypothetical protein [Atopobium fossor]|uniref:hypothetical protein n=1 Tax=Atopobium fossor TaxID=39487 RepID=UPI00041DA705|nr:hypothetical protein [Atopobium fossor]